jgi:hypothetical protein
MLSPLPSIGFIPSFPYGVPHVLVGGDFGRCTLRRQLSLIERGNVIGMLKYHPHVVFDQHDRVM